jgi:uncharacterized membrane protein YgaE (UPF0421/DUF939 family)
MEIFIIIISIIVAILNIILFFKIWDATDNIKEIKNAISKDSSLRFLLLTNDNDKIYNQLNKNLFDDLCNIAKKYFETSENFSFTKEKEQILNDYSKSYSKINKQIPNKFFTVTSTELMNIDDINDYEEI